MMSVPDNVIGTDAMTLRGSSFTHYTTRPGCSKVG